MYADCGCEHHTIKLALPDDLDDILKGFLKGIHDGTIKPGHIDQDYLNYVADKLKSGAAEGLGGTSFGADDYRNTLKAFLDQNIYAFSSARSLYMLEQYRSFLTGPDGKLLSEAQFISKVSVISEIDNVTHLKVERNDAIAKAQAAESWETLQVHELLEYRSMMNEKVCPICSGLNGLVLRTDDPALNIIWIPNHYGCFCKFVPAGSEMERSPSDLVGNRIKAANIPTDFRRNVGKQRFIFSNDHPYMQKIGVDKLSELDAVKNYGMRSGERIYDNDTLPTFDELPDKDTANAWWTKMAGSQRGSFDIKAVDDLSVLFDNDFRNHVLEQNSDDRYRLFGQIKEVLQNPDEVWSNRLKDNIHSVYIKYYKDTPIALITEADEKVRAVTLYEVKKEGNINYKALNNMRKGILKYRSR